MVQMKRRLNKLKNEVFFSKHLFITNDNYAIENDYEEETTRIDVKLGIVTRVKMAKQMHKFHSDLIEFIEGYELKDDEVKRHYLFEDSNKTDVNGK